MPPPLVFPATRDTCAFTPLAIVEAVSLSITRRFPAGTVKMVCRASREPIGTPRTVMRETGVGLLAAAVRTEPFTVTGPPSVTGTGLVVPLMTVTSLGDGRACSGGAVEKRKAQRASAARTATVAV